MGQEDCALEYLEKACDHVIISAEEKPEDKYRSLLLREVEVYYVGSEAAKQLYSFLKPWREKGSPFDSLRDKPRFQAVIERLREYALETAGDA